MYYVNREPALLQLGSGWTSIRAAFKTSCIGFIVLALQIWYQKMEPTERSGMKGISNGHVSMCSRRIVCSDEIWSSLVHEHPERLFKNAVRSNFFTANSEPIRDQLIFFRSITTSPYSNSWVVHTALTHKVTPAITLVAFRKRSLEMAAAMKGRNMSDSDSSTDPREQSDGFRLQQPVDRIQRWTATVQQLGMQCPGWLDDGDAAPSVTDKAAAASPAGAGRPGTIAGSQAHATAESCNRLEGISFWQVVPTEHTKCRVNLAKCASNLSIWTFGSLLQPQVPCRLSSYTFETYICVYRYIWISTHVYIYNIYTYRQIDTYAFFWRCLESTGANWCQRSKRWFSMRPKFDIIIYFIAWLSTFRRATAVVAPSLQQWLPKAKAQNWKPLSQQPCAISFCPWPSAFLAGVSAGEMLKAGDKVPEQGAAPQETTKPVHATGGVRLSVPSIDCQQPSVCGNPWLTRTALQPLPSWQRSAKSSMLSPEHPIVSLRAFPGPDNRASWST